VFLRLLARRAARGAYRDMTDELLQRVRQCTNLPSLPAVALQILSLTQRADVDIAGIAKIISKDPALAGRILRTVNSSFYGRPQHVGTISQALVILGLQSVKTLVLGFSLVTNLAKHKTSGFRHLVYWKRSIFAATAARTVAARVNLVQQEEAFLAALLADIGMLVFDRVLGDRYGEVHTVARTHAELSAAELPMLGADHAEVGGLLAEDWRLPPILTVPIANHHTPERVMDPHLRRLTELVRIGGRCADVFVDEFPAAAIGDVRKWCRTLYDLPETQCDLLLDEIGKRTREVAGLFEIQIGTPTQYEAILKRANEALVELTLQTQQQTVALQQQTVALQEQNVRLQRQATTDGLTGLANRAQLDAFLAEQFAAARASGRPLAVLMLDLDRFKAINDRYGHPVGDTVLRYVARLLRTAARAQDLAARYGGEEFALVLPGTTRATAAAIAETIRRAIATKPVHTDGGPSVAVTASIGVAAMDADARFMLVPQFVKAADLAVYNAKHSGRNCVRVFTPPPRQTTAASAVTTAPGATSAAPTSPAAPSAPASAA
jgi:two-component system, cell cycle response regulator